MHDPKAWGTRLVGFLAYGALATMVLLPMTILLIGLGPFAHQSSGDLASLSSSPSNALNFWTILFIYPTLVFGWIAGLKALGMVVSHIDGGKTWMSGYFGLSDTTLCFLVALMNLVFAVGGGLLTIPRVDGLVWVLVGFGVIIYLVYAARKPV